MAKAQKLVIASKWMKEYNGSTGFNYIIHMMFYINNLGLITSDHVASGQSSSSEPDISDSESNFSFFFSGLHPVGTPWWGRFT